MTLPSLPGRPLQAAAVLSLLLSTSCAAIAAAEANKRLPGTIADGELTPARPPAAAFGADPTRTCPSTGAYGEIETRLAAAVKDRGAVEVPADGRLCGVAEALLGWQGEQVPPHVRAAVGRYFGLPGGAPELVLVTLETDDPRLVAERISETIQSYGARVTGPRYGVAGQLAAYKKGGDRAAQDATKPKTRVALALYSETVRLDQPLPRRLALGQKATVAGALTGDLENPKVVVSDAKGRVTTVEPPPGKTFQAEVSCEDRPGRILVEVRGEDLGNERIIETIPVACATELPTRVALAPPAAWPADPALQEQKIVEAVNGERTQAGLPPLTASEPVARIARALAEAMRDGSKKGATVTPVNIAQRLAEADIQAPVATQNPAAAPTAEVAHGLLANNSAARANMMSTEFSDFGVGVAIGADAQGKPMTWVAELFIKVQPPPDVAASKRVIREAIDKKRVAEKLAPLTADAGLEKLAGDYAAVVAAAGGPPPKSETEKLMKALKQGYRDTVFMVDARVDLSDFAEDPNALAAGKLVGLGGALGRHPRLGKNTLFVVLIIANKLPGKK
jgi:uncharacterized protein YkwD